MLERICRSFAPAASRQQLANDSPESRGSLPIQVVDPKAFKLNYEVKLHTKPNRLQDFNVISLSSSEEGSSSQSSSNSNVGEDPMSDCSEAGEDIPFESKYDAALAAKLSYEHLASLTMVGNKSAEPNKYQQNGKCTTRIRGVLKGGVYTCKRECGRRVSFKMLLGICSLFWGLGKVAQDSLLWSLACRRQSFASNGEDDEDSDDDPHDKRVSRRAWCLDVTPVCRAAFVKMLGISDKRVNRIAHTYRGTDLRTIGGGPE